MPDTVGNRSPGKFGILPDYHEVTVHDALPVYGAYPATHALNEAHWVREFTATSEAHPDRGGWSAATRDAVLGLNTAAHSAREAGVPQIPSEIADPLTHRWYQAIHCGLAEHPRCDGRKQTKTRNILEHLRGRDDQVLRFIHDLFVPFASNLAKCDLRPTKIQLKISGYLRSSGYARSETSLPALRGRHHWQPLDTTLPIGGS